VTPEQQQLAIWGGGILAVIVAGASVLAWRGGELDAQAAKARQLQADYGKLYHPETPKDGIPAPDAERDLLRAKDLQSEELEKAETSLVVEMRGSYLVGDLVSAVHQVYADHQTIRQTAQMKKVALPQALPYDSPLDQDDARRAVQLANLYLYRAVLDQCIRCGVQRVNSVAPGKAEQDPTGGYVLLSCDFDVDGTYESGQHLLLSLLESHRAGIGLSSLAMDAPAEGRQHLRFTASLITPARAGFVGEAPKRAAEPAGQPRVVPRGRLGGG
jgi:hypothetical protein